MATGGLDKQLADEGRDDQRLLAIVERCVDANYQVCDFIQREGWLQDVALRIAHHLAIQSAHLRVERTVAQEIEQKEVLEHDGRDVSEGGRQVVVERVDDGRLQGGHEIAGDQVLERARHHGEDGEAVEEPQDLVRGTRRTSIVSKFEEHSPGAEQKVLQERCVNYNFGRKNKVRQN